MMGGSARKKARKEAGTPYQKPAKTPTKRYRTAKEEQGARRADRATAASMSALTLNMLAMSGYSRRFTRDRRGE